MQELIDTVNALGPKFVVKSTKELENGGVLVCGTFEVEDDAYAAQFKEYIEKLENFKKQEMKEHREFLMNNYVAELETRDKYTRRCIAEAQNMTLDEVDELIESLLLQNYKESE